MKDAFFAVETMNTIFMGLVKSMCVVLIYNFFYNPLRERYNKKI